MVNYMSYSLQIRKQRFQKFIQPINDTAKSQTQGELIPQICTLPTLLRVSKTISFFPVHSLSNVKKHYDYVDGMDFIITDLCENEILFPFI